MDKWDSFLGAPVERPEEALKAARALANALGIDTGFFLQSKLSFLAGCLRYLVYFSRDHAEGREALVGLSGLIALTGLPVLQLFDRLMTAPGNEELLQVFSVPLKARCKDQLEGMVDEAIYPFIYLWRHHLKYAESRGFVLVKDPEAATLCVRAKELLGVPAFCPSTGSWNFLGHSVGKPTEAIRVAYRLLSLLRQVYKERRMEWDHYRNTELYYLALCVQFIGWMCLDPKVDAKRLQSFRGLSILVDRNILNLFELFRSVPALEELLEPFRGALDDRDAMRLVELTGGLDLVICYCSGLRLCVAPDGDFFVERSALNDNDWVKENMELKKLIDTCVKGLHLNQMA